MEAEAAGGPRLQVNRTNKAEKGRNAIKGAGYRKLVSLMSK